MHFRLPYSSVSHVLRSHTEKAVKEFRCLKVALSKYLIEMPRYTAQ